MVGSLMKTGQRLRIRQVRWLVGIELSWLVILVIPSVALAGPARSGEQIYREQCASCHGSKGEGTDDHYPPRLSVSGLSPGSRLIAKTMPEDAPGDCVGKDAEKVAAYIYELFYSKSAGVCNKFEPSRIELSRLPCVNIRTRSPIF